MNPESPTIDAGQAKRPRRRAAPPLPGERMPVTWAAATFGLVIGVLMTYVPYEFQASIFRVVYPQIRLLGASLLLGGALLGVVALYPSWSRAVGWTGRAVFVGALATYWWTVNVLQGGVTGAILYPIMMICVVIEGRPEARRRGIFPWFVIAVCLPFGALMAFAPELLAHPPFLALGPMSVPLGVTFLIGGVGLLVTREPRTRRALFALIAAAFCCVGYVLARGGSWTGAALYAVLAPACLAAGWVSRMPRLTSVRWRLVRGMVVAGVLPLLALGAVASTAAQRAIEDEVRAQARMAAVAEAEWLRLQLEDEEGAPAVVPIEELAHARTAASAAYRVRIVDARNGALLRDTGGEAGRPAALQPDLADAVWSVAARPTASALVETFDAQGRRVLAAIHRVEGRPWVVVVSEDLAATYAPITRLSAAVVAFLLLAALLALALSGWVARAVTAPLHDLRAAASELASGDLDRRVSAGGPDEIADLGRAFNDMAERVARAQRDLSELKDALAQRLEEAEEASRLKDEFLSVVSHELRTPLNAILGWARMLRSGAVPEGARSRAMETIERNAALQAKLVEDLLDASRIVSGKLQLELSEVDLGRVLQSAVDSVTLAAEAREIHLTLETPSGGGARMPALVRGDAGRLQQVLWNLLTNAIKFTPRGGRVEAQLGEGDEGTVRVTVRDTGQGISADFLPHVFERFRQADATATRKHGGLGLGLAIVRQLVEAHGGTVRADSEGLGKGATFTVELPRAQSRWSAPVISVHAADLPSLAGMRVLVVDDELDAAEMAEAALGAAGAEVRTAGSAEEALGVVPSWMPDVLVSDIGMPDVDGYTLIRKVRALPAEAGGEVPAIALTAYVQADDRVRALSAGYQLHVPKPVDPRELALAVANLGRYARGRGSG